MAEPNALDDDGRMPFAEHLQELRIRLRNSIIALIVGVCVAYGFKEEIFVLLARPLLDVWNEMRAQNAALGEPQFVFTSLLEPFWTYFSLSIWAGLFVASPVIFHQLWKFIAPGLYRNERRYGIAFACASAICFVGGAAFCYELVLPQVYDFLLGYATDDLGKLSTGLGDFRVGPSVAATPFLSMEKYVGLGRNLLLGFGLIFELPLLLVFLSIAGLVTHRSLWRFNRWWIVVSFVVAAILTPTPDVITQVMMAAPLVVLYNLSIVLAWLITRSREARAAAIDRGEHEAVE